MKILPGLVLIILAVFAVPNVQAQLCGQSFASFIVKDSADKSIQNVTIELLAALSDEQHKELWEKYAYKGEGFQPGIHFKIPSSTAEGIIKQSPPLSRTQDYCGNPLKQTAGKTKIKNWNDARNDGEGSKENFGFCAIETSSAQFLLKISAPGYITDYYIGKYLGGCLRAWNFVLIKKGDLKIKYPK